MSLVSDISQITCFSPEKNKLLQEIYNFSYDGTFRTTSVKELFRPFLDSNTDRKVSERISKDIQFFTNYVYDEDVGPIVDKHIIALQNFKKIFTHREEEWFASGHLWDVAALTTFVSIPAFTAWYFGATLEGIKEASLKIFEKAPIRFSCGVVISTAFLSYFGLYKYLLSPIASRNGAESQLSLKDFSISTDLDYVPYLILLPTDPDLVMVILAAALKFIYWTERYYNPSLFCVMLSDLFRDNLLNIDSLIQEKQGEGLLSFSEREELEKTHSERSKFINRLNSKASLYWKGIAEPPQ